MKLDLKKIPVVYMNLEKHVDKNDSMFNMLKQMGFTSIHRVEGVIDSDYMEETFIMITNISTRNMEIANLSRICQGEIVKNNRVSFEEISERPTRDNTNRKGGFGSTGTEVLDNPSANTI